MTILKYHCSSEALYYSVERLCPPGISKYRTNNIDADCHSITYML